ncbi:MAG: organic solvent tolerance protein OstA [Selenomonas sp.]|nr:organic solvent tolerance protein OstA [Selenomonas sp.]
MTRRMKKMVMALTLALAVPLGHISAEGEPAELNADTVEYDMSTGLAVATGDVLLKQGSAKVTGAKATYNAKTQEGSVEGNVIAVRDTMRLTCNSIMTNGQGYIRAAGSVRGTDGDKSFAGEQVDYYPNQNKYIKIPAGGTISNADGTFSANYMEGWLDDEHYVGKGNVHIESPAHQMEAGGDNADYVGKEQGRVVLTGNAWAVKENNTMKSNKLTLYLDPEGRAEVK